MLTSISVDWVKHNYYVFARSMPIDACMYAFVINGTCRMFGLVVLAADTAEQIVVFLQIVQVLLHVFCRLHVYANGRDIHADKRHQENETAKLNNISAL